MTIRKNRRGFDSYIFPPEGGWEEGTWYRGECSMRPSNPVFKVLIYTGFLDNGEPSSYHEIIPERGYEGNTFIDDVFYLSVTEKLFTADARQRDMPIDVLKSRGVEI